MISGFIDVKHFKYFELCTFGHSYTTVTRFSKIDYQQNDCLELTITTAINKINEVFKQLFTFSYTGLSDSNKLFPLTLILLLKTFRVINGVNFSIFWDT